MLWPRLGYKGPELGPEVEGPVPHRAGMSSMAHNFLLQTSAKNLCLFKGPVYHFKIFGRRERGDAQNERGDASL